MNGTEHRVRGAAERARAGPLRPEDVPADISDFVARFAENDGHRAKAVAHTLRHPLTAWRVIGLVRALPTEQIAFPASTCPAAKQALLLSVRRRLGPVPTGRLAQSVLSIPPAGADPLAGQRRQALRTNVNRLLRDGHQVNHVEPDEAHATIDQVLHDLDYDQAGIDGAHARARMRHTHAWVATDAAGRPTGFTLVTVAAPWGRLFISVSRPGSGVHWLLHAGTVTGLQELGCRALIVESALTLTPGLQHFQSRTGFEAVNLRYDRADADGQVCTCEEPSAAPG